jgi:hypothetical protein
VLILVCIWNYRLSSWSEIIGERGIFTYIKFSNSIAEIVFMFLTSVSSVLTKSHSKNYYSALQSDPMCVIEAKLNLPVMHSYFLNFLFSLLFFCSVPLY